MTRGRKPTPPETLKLHGTFRQDRHAERELAPQAEGTPQKPDYLDGDAAWFWDFVVSELSTNGTAKRLDTMELTAAAEMWQLYRKSFALAKENPIDKENRISVTAYLSAWEAAAAKLGLNPTDRQKIRTATKPKKEDGKSRFFRT